LGKQLRNAIGHEKRRRVLPPHHKPSLMEPGKPGVHAKSKRQKSAKQHPKQQTPPKIKTFQNKIWEDDLYSLDTDDGSTSGNVKELRNKKTPVRP
ncbi:hypothetical protein TNCV_2197951, partial [Trichonephila clavipes]